ncbi:MAG: YdcF family protein [Acidimicrobiales bacterium]|nr:YdcF family protein [Acidimicrobiales bacterium]
MTALGGYAPELERPPRRRARRSRWRLLVRLGLMLLGLLLVYVSVTFVQVYRASRDDTAAPADAIIVLGAAQYDGRPSPVLKQRLDHAFELYERDLAPRIVLTGGRQEGDRFTEATTGYNYLRERGVPDQALLREVDGTNTWDSLAASARFLIDQDLRRVVLVTDGYHALRVGAIADDLGLDAAVSPVNSRLSAAGEVRQLLREAVAVSIGRLIGYDRLFRIDEVIHAD